MSGATTEQLRTAHEDLFSRFIEQRKSLVTAYVIKIKGFRAGMVLANSCWSYFGLGIRLYKKVYLIMVAEAAYTFKFILLKI